MMKAGISASCSRPQLVGEKARRLHRGLLAVIEVAGDQERVDLLDEAEIDDGREGLARRAADELGKRRLAQRQRAQRRIEMNVGGMNESERHGRSSGSPPNSGEVTASTHKAVDKPACRNARPWGKGPAREQDRLAAARLRDRILSCGPTADVTRLPDSVENAARVRVSRSLHWLWREAVRMPLKRFRAPAAAARRPRARTAGCRSSVDWTTELTTVPFDGRFPPPLAQCVVVEPCEYRTKLHPLSVNSTTTEAMHYVDHTVHAPAMTLEHLVDQYWFPALGLLVSEDGPRLAPFLPRAVPGGLPRVGQGDRRPARPGRRRASRLFYPERLARAPRIAGERLLIANSEKPNYGHYLLDIVPLIHLGGAHARADADLDAASPGSGR